MHNSLDDLAFLVGGWDGQGRGLWDPDSPLEYQESVDFAEFGGPFISYRQQTWSSDGTRRLHTETGYLRPQPAGQLELILVQPTGIAEIHIGRIEDQRIELQSTTVARSPTARPVTAVRRQLVIDGDRLDYQVSISMNDEPLSGHLEGHLNRRGNE